MTVQFIRDDTPHKRVRVFNLGYLHLNNIIQDPKIFYCPSDPNYIGFDPESSFYGYPFDYYYNPRHLACCQRISYGYVPQSTGREELVNGHYAYGPSDKNETLNSRAPLAFDAVYSKYERSHHLGSGRRVAGMNILYGDGSVRFRHLKDSEREFWDVHEQTENEKEAMRALLYMFSE